MKVIPLSKAKANLSRYGRLCRKEPVIVTVKGIPSFQLVPVDEDAESIDRILQTNRRLHELARRRARERSIPARDLLKRL